MLQAHIQQKFLYTKWNFIKDICYKKAIAQDDDTGFPRCTKNTSFSAVDTQGIKVRSCMTQN